MSSDFPVILVCFSTRERFDLLVSACKVHPEPQVLKEFHFVYCDSWTGIRSWYIRNKGKYVALIVLEVDFSEIPSGAEGRLVTFSTPLRPTVDNVDIKRFQGLVIFEHIRQSGLDQVAPVLFIVSEANIEVVREFATILGTAGYGNCSFASGDLTATSSLGDIIYGIYNYALRPLSEHDRQLWRERYRMVMGRSRRMALLAQDIERLAVTDSTVLILGEQGVGKEMVARALHRMSFRYKEPNHIEPVALHMTALERSLVVDELFGHEKGAFTDARSERAGIFETARGSTVFLDEIGDIDQELQTKLRRVIEYKKIKRLGSSIEREVDVRIIAATNLPLETLQEKFRPDFYSRMVQECIYVPSVRERWTDEIYDRVIDDIGELFWFVVEEKNQSPWVRNRLKVDMNAIKFLARLVISYIAGRNDLFSGNMRSLCSLIERAYDRAQFERAPVVGMGHVASALPGLTAPARQSTAGDGTPGTKMSLEKLVGSLKLEDIEKVALIEALNKTGGNQTRAAILLGIHRDTLIKKLRRYQLS